MRPDRKLTLASVCGTHAAQDGLTASIYVLLPVLARTFELGYAQIGIIRAAYSGAMWMLEVPSGLLAERFGERRLLVLGLVGAGAGYLVLSQAGGFVTVLLALAIAGAGGAFQHALSSALVSRSFDGPARRTALGTYNASGDVGKLSFTGAASLLLGAGIAWQGIAALYGVLVLGFAAVVWWALRAAPAPRTTGNVASGKVRGWGIRHRPAFSALAFIVFIDIAVQDGFFVFVTFLMLEKGVSPGIAAFAVVATLAGGVLGKLGCGYLSARLGVVRALVLVEGLCALGILAVYLAPGWAAFALLPILGVVLQGSSSITYGAVSTLVHEDRQSRGFAAIYTMSAGASAVGPIVFGLVSDRMGVEAAVGLMAVAVLLPLAACRLLGAGLKARAVAAAQ